MSANEQQHYEPIDPLTIRTIMVDSTDFKRLESKVDLLAEAMTKLILVEERQTSQGERIGKLEQQLVIANTRITEVDNKVEKWINRGMGIWAVAATIWTAYVQFNPHK